MLLYSTDPIQFDGDESYMAKVDSRPRGYLNLNQVFMCDGLCKWCGSNVEEGISDVKDAVIYYLNLKSIRLLVIFPVSSAFLMSESILKL